MRSPQASVRDSFRKNLDALEPCRRVFHDRAVLDFDFEEVAS